ncbi:MAG: hypothetical protein NC548_13060 [Lachnospiraceae bacterium]|nr:hypothetical protein [Lachnospiraceae bacterium]MCM1230681.1 hypothetical protein [Ruminococcus flavefaciens]
MNIFDIIKALALLTYAIMIPFAMWGDHDKSREFFEDHKILRALIGGLSILGGILFIIDLCTGKII